MRKSSFVIKEEWIVWHPEMFENFLEGYVGEPAGEVVIGTYEDDMDWINFTRHLWFEGDDKPVQHMTTVLMTRIMQKEKEDEQRRSPRAAA